MLINYILLLANSSLLVVVELWGIQKLYTCGFSTMRRLAPLTSALFKGHLHKRITTWWNGEKQWTEGKFLILWLSFG